MRYTSAACGSRELERPDRELILRATQPPGCEYAAGAASIIPGPDLSGLLLPDVFVSSAAVPRYTSVVRNFWAQADARVRAALCVARSRCTRLGAMDTLVSTTQDPTASNACTAGSDCWFCCCSQEAALVRSKGRSPPVPNKPLTHPLRPTSHTPLATFMSANQQPYLLASLPSLPVVSPLASTSKMRTTKHGISRLVIR